MLDIESIKADKMITYGLNGMPHWTAVIPCHLVVLHFCSVMGEWAKNVHIMPFIFVHFIIAIFENV